MTRFLPADFTGASDRSPNFFCRGASVLAANGGVRHGGADEPSFSTRDIGCRWIIQPKPDRDQQRLGRTSNLDAQLMLARMLTMAWLDTRHIQLGFERQIS